MTETTLCSNEERVAIGLVGFAIGSFIMEMFVTSCFGVCR